jgi:hypothetical protein
MTKDEYTAMLPDTPPLADHKEENEESRPYDAIEDEERGFRAFIKNKVEDYLARKNVEGGMRNRIEKMLTDKGFKPRKLTTHEREQASQNFLKRFRSADPEYHSEDEEASSRRSGRKKC